MSRVVHFEIGADDVQRAKRFYEETFGWKIQKWEGPMDYWMIMTGDESAPGIDGGLGPRQEGMGATVNTIDVPSVEKALQKIGSNGGKVVVPKGAVPGVGWLAYFQDPEGNTFGLMERDESAQ